MENLVGFFFAANEIFIDNSLKENHFVCVIF